MNTATQTETKQWTSEAGPIQTKKVKKALQALNWLHGGKRQLRGVIGGEEHSSIVTSLFGGEKREDILIAHAEIQDKYDGVITRDNYRDIIADLEAATAKGKETMPVEDERITLEEAAQRKVEAEERRQENARHSEERAIAVDKFKQTIPAGAKAAIVAKLHEDQSDVMSDYHAHTTVKTVILAWSTHTKDRFDEMRKAAATFEETKHLGPGCDIHKVIFLDPDEEAQSPGWSGHAMKDEQYNDCKFTTEAEAEAAAKAYIAKIKAERDESMQDHGSWAGSALEANALAERYRIDSSTVEHREKYSMGAGYYLKAGFCDSTGWAVEKMDLSLYGTESLSDAEDRSNGLFVKQLGRTPTESAPEDTGGPQSSKSPQAAHVEKHYHTKRECDVFIVVLAERVDRPTFEQIRRDCRRAGGWYCRKWGKTPGGFAFENETETNTFAANIG